MKCIDKNIKMFARLHINTQAANGAVYELTLCDRVDPCLSFLYQLFKMSPNTSSKQKNTSNKYDKMTEFHRNEQPMVYLPDFRSAINADCINNVIRCITHFTQNKHTQALIGLYPYSIITIFGTVSTRYTRILF